MHKLTPAGVRLLLGTVLATLLVVPVSPAVAGPGYELDDTTPSISLIGQVPRGVAIDQASQTLYVAEVTTNTSTAAPGRIEQLTTSGIPTGNSPFSTGGDDYFAGVAVNPVSHGIYAYQIQIVTPFGTFGTARMDTFSSTGVPGPSFSPPNAGAPQPATDSSGRVYVPNNSVDAVQVFNSAGTLQDSIPCTGCPGGAFSEPIAAAIDSAGNLYVVDLGNGGRAIKFVPFEGSYAYASELQSGAGAAAVGVDPVSNDVFVGDLTSDGYRIVVYDSSGVAFDDFGDGAFAQPFMGTAGAGQIAVSATTRKVYIADSGANKVRVFKRVASIPPPTATTDPAVSPGQLDASLRATVDPKGHSLTDCHFEYTDAADFLANGFANASSLPCGSKPGGNASTVVVAHATGLTPGTEYTYRIVVASYGGTAQGSEQSFETLPPLPPDATATTASALTQTSATIAGSTNPHGGPVSDCHFEYTEQTDFEEKGYTGATATDCPFTPDGTEDNPVSTKITALTADTVYRFRLVVTNNAGTTESGSQSFSTLADTCQTKPSLCPPPEEKPPVEQPPSQPPSQQPPTTSPPATTPKPLKCRKGFKKKKVRGKPKCVKIKRPPKKRR